MSVSRGAVSTQLGDDFRFTTEITNQGRRTLTGLVASLNVVGLSSGIYVDPEDWSSERTKRVPTLGPGESTSISWSVTAVTGGHAAVYVVVLPEDPGDGQPVSSPAIDVRIADTKDFNSGGVLPLALGRAGAARPADAGNAPPPHALTRHRAPVICGRATELPSFAAGRQSSTSFATAAEPSVLGCICRETYSRE